MDVALRMIDLVLPAEKVAEADRFLDGAEVVDRWDSVLTDERVKVQALVRASRTEALLDELHDRFGHMKGFRVVLSEVGVTIPAVPAEETVEPEPAAAVSDEERPIAGRVSRQELQSAMNGAVGGSMDYLVFVALSAIVAAIGMLGDSVAVVVAAMVIAPLLGPNMALALAITTGDDDLARRAVRRVTIGVSLTLALSTLLGFVLAQAGQLRLLDASEVITRTRTSPVDFVLALASGVAGTLAFTTGASSTLIGVMVAVALMPPLVVVGMELGAMRLSECVGAVALVGTNVLCILLSATSTFALMGVRPRRWWQANRAAKRTRMAVGAFVVLLALLFVVTVLRSV